MQADDRTAQIIKESVREKIHTCLQKNKIL